MNAINHTANRHEWWWMVTGFDNDPLSPCQDYSSSRGPSLDGGIAFPGTALEAAFHRAMLPFGQMYMALVASSASAAPALREPRAGAKVAVNYRSERRNIAAGAANTPAGLRTR